MGIGNFAKKLIVGTAAEIATNNGFQVAKKIASIERELDVGGGTYLLTLPEGHYHPPLEQVWWPVFVYLDARGYGQEETKDPEGHTITVRIVRPNVQQNV